MSQKVTAKKPTEEKPKMMIKCQDFEKSRFSFTEIQTEVKNAKYANKNQFTSFARYNYGKGKTPLESQFVFRTDRIKLSQYGIPRPEEVTEEMKAAFDKKKSDRERCSLKIPYDKSQAGCVELFEMFTKVDEYMSVNKDKLFPGKLAKFAKLYDYTPIVRKPQDIINIDGEEEEEDTKPKKKTDSKTEEKERFDYTKLKFNVEFGSGDIKTKFFVRENGVPVPKDLKSLDQVRENVTWNSTIQFFASLSKIWVSKSGDKNGRRSYGVTFKIEQLEVVEKAESSAGNKQTFSKYMFDDDNTTKATEDATEDAGEEVAEDAGEGEGEDADADADAGEEADADAEEVDAEEEDAEAEEEAEEEADEEEPEPEPEPVKPKVVAKKAPVQAKVVEAKPAAKKTTPKPVPKKK